MQLQHMIDRKSVFLNVILGGGGGGGGGLLFFIGYKMGGLRMTRVRLDLCVHVENTSLHVSKLLGHSSDQTEQSWKSYVRWSVIRNVKRSPEALQQWWPEHRTFHYSPWQSVACSSG